MNIKISSNPKIRIILNESVNYQKKKNQQLSALDRFAWVRRSRRFVYGQNGRRLHGCLCLSKVTRRLVPRARTPSLSAFPKGSQTVVRHLSSSGDQQQQRETHGNGRGDRRIGSRPRRAVGAAGCPRSPGSRRPEGRRRPFGYFPAGFFLVFVSDFERATSLSFAALTRFPSPSTRLLNVFLTCTLCPFRFDVSALTIGSVFKNLCGFWRFSCSV